MGKLFSNVEDSIEGCCIGPNGSSFKFSPFDESLVGWVDVGEFKGDPDGITV